MTVNGLSPRSPTPAVSATTGISAETTIRSLSRGPPKRIGAACPATHDLRTSTKNSFSLLDQTPECKNLALVNSSTSEVLQITFCSGAAWQPAPAPLPSHVQYL